MSTADRAYTVTAGSNAPMTLYEALKALKAAERNDGTHVRRDSRPVAFWCDWEHKPKPCRRQPGCGASADEIQAIEQAASLLS